MYDTNAAIALVTWTEESRRSASRPDRLMRHELRLARPRRRPFRRTR